MLKSMLLRTLDKAVVRASILVVLLSAVLCFLANFSARQSLVLAAIGVFLYWLVLWIQEKPPFVPYRVFVDPNMRSVLTDFQLLEDTEEAWANIQQAIERLPHHTANIWEYGFRVSFVTPELIYDNGWKRFMTRLEMYARLDIADENIYRWQNVDIAQLLSGSLSLYFERGYLGYSLGVVLAKQEWEKVRHSEYLKRIPETDIKAIGEGGFEVKVRLAVIPDEEFIFYSTATAGNVDRVERALRRRAEARVKYGWKGKPEKTWQPEDRSDTIENRYFTVWHSAL